MIIFILITNLILWLVFGCTVIKIKKMEEDNYLLQCEFQALENSLKSKSYRFISEDDFEKYKIQEEQRLSDVLDTCERRIIEKVKKTKEERWESLEKAFQLR